MIGFPFSPVIMPVTVPTKINPKIMCATAMPVKYNKNPVVCNKPFNEQHGKECIFSVSDIYNTR